ncbi:MAG TPA: beta-propeller fold lactonase family protein, partial [Terriglobales bacterium]|nr:beta-propeller fold lactonase family protein [Terriglobales bacterium]
MPKVTLYFPLACLMLLGVAGCGSTHHHFVYAVGTNSEGVFGFEEASGGVLSKISGSPFSTGSLPTAIAVTPSRAYAYVLSSGGNGILTYTFDKSKGGLVAAAGAVATGSGPVSVAIDPSSQHLYVLNQDSSNISAYSIDAFNGTLSPVSGSPFTATNGPVSLAMSHKGDILYVVSRAQGIASFSIKSDGTLSAAQSAIPAGAAPAFVAATSGDRFVYVADPVSNAVLGFSVSGTSLTPISNGSFTAGTGPVALAADPQGKFLFAANQGSSNVSAFAIGSNGALTQVS